MAICEGEDEAEEKTGGCRRETEEDVRVEWASHGSISRRFLAARQNEDKEKGNKRGARSKLARIRSSKRALSREQGRASRQSKDLRGKRR